MDTLPRELLLLRIVPLLELKGWLALRNTCAAFRALIPAPVAIQWPLLRGIEEVEDTPLVGVALSFQSAPPGSEFGSRRAEHTRRARAANEAQAFVQLLHVLARCRERVSMLRVGLFSPVDAERLFFLFPVVGELHVHCPVYSPAPLARLTSVHRLVVGRVTAHSPALYARGLTTTLELLLRGERRWRWISTLREVQCGRGAQYGFRLELIAAEELAEAAGTASESAQRAAIANPWVKRTERPHRTTFASLECIDMSLWCWSELREHAHLLLRFLVLRSPQCRRLRGLGGAHLSAALVHELTAQCPLLETVDVFLLDEAELSYAHLLLALSRLERLHSLTLHAGQIEYTVALKVWDGETHTRETCFQALRSLVVSDASAVASLASVAASFPLLSHLTLLRVRDEAHCDVLLQEATMLMPNTHVEVQVAQPEDE